MNGDGRRLELRTTEGVAFTYRLASPLLRMVAWMVDSLVVLSAWSLLQGLLRLVASLSLDGARLIAVLLFFLLSVGYPVLCEWRWRGRTLGKRLLRLRVMDDQGRPLTGAQVLVRNLMRAVDALPLAYALGGAVAWFSPRAQRLGDLAAGTVVVWDPAELPPDWERIGAVELNPLLRPSHLAARLRQVVSPAEARLLLEACLRRGEMEATERARLFGDLARIVRARVRWSPQQLEGLSDERLVCCGVELLFRRENSSRETGSPPPLQPQVRA